MTSPGPAGRLGIAPGMLVQVLGQEAAGLEVARDLLDDVAATTGEEFVPETSDEVVDVVMLWFRDEDGDLVDALVDARRPLDDGGVVWLLTPKAGRDGHIEPSDVQEAVPTAGLQMTSTVSASPAWSGSRLVAPKNGRVQRR